MNKGLDLIKRQQPEIIDGYPTGNIFIGVTKEELTELEKELKEKEKQDFVYNILKEVIQFNVLQPELKETDNGYSFVSGIALKMQRELENKERQLFRNWVLEECFPKELKALEIIKKYPRCSLQRYIGFNEMVKEGYELTQEHLFIHDMPCSVEEYNIVIEGLL